MLQDLIRKEMQKNGTGDVHEVDEHGNPVLHDVSVAIGALLVACC